MKKYGGIAVFIFKILNELSCQLRVPSDLRTGKYPPVGLAVERWLHGPDRRSGRVREEINILFQQGIERRSSRRHPVF